MQAAAALAGLLLVALAASASIRVEERATVFPRGAVPVTLAAGAAGTTVLGESKTSASTTGAVLPLLGAVTVLSVQPGGATWTVRVRAVSVSAGADTMTVALAGVTQVTVVAGALSLTTGDPVTLSSLALPITVSGACVLTCTFELRLLLSPPGGGPALEYPYRLSVT